MSVAVALASIFLTPCNAVYGQAAVGSQIEVREGDAWTNAKVIGREGRRVQVRYDDGTEEWIGPERLRPNAGGVAGSSAPGVTVAPENAGDPIPKPASRTFSVDQPIEIKRDGKWFPAKVRQLSKGWIFVSEDADERQKRWVEPWALRVPGSAYDIDSTGTRTWAAKPGQVAPVEAPKKAASPTGDQFVIVPEDQRPPTKEDLAGKFDRVSFDNSHEPPVRADRTLRIATTQPASAEFSAWALRGVDNRLDTILVCTGGLKTAVASFPGSFGKSTVVIRTGLLAHNQMDTRSLQIPDIKVAAAASDGDVLLTTFEWDKNLQWWQWSGGKYKLAANLRVDPDDGTSITAAELVAADKAIVGVSNGTVYLVDLAKKQVITSVKCAPGAKLFMHPSGQLIGVVTSSSTAMLLRSEDFSLIAEFPDASSTSNITVDSTGQWAAYVTSAGVVRVVKIDDGTQLGLLSVGAAFKGRLDLVDDKFLLVDSTTAYEIKSGIPVWIYKIPADARVKPLANGQFVIAAPGNKMASIAVASIPDQVGRVAMKSASLDRFMLVPGKAIKIEADFSAFVDDKEKASEVVNDVIRRAGMKVSENNEPFRLTLSVAPGPTEKREYMESSFYHPAPKIVAVDIPSNVLTATLSLNDQPVWTQEIRFAAGSMIQRDKDQPIQEYCNNAAIPNAGALKGLNLPSYLPIGAKPGVPAALGASTLQDRRFVPEKPAGAARP
ncbi:MAG: hypothetical protein H7144_13105 [Burkholderiales bacterium]|nr:hypothetical protein [Phycisphaerae bacterium]